MSRILHLSDIHLSTTDPAGQEHIFSSMARAIRQAATEERPGGESGIDLVMVSGDLFDSSGLDEEEAIYRFQVWYGTIKHALGRETVPMFIVPGNHDVRKRGVVGFHSPRLLQALQWQLSKEGNVTVHGCQPPFLAKHVSREAHPLPAEVVLLDSTYLPGALFSAGGLIRQEDLLHVASELPRQTPSVPLVLLAHHHMIPTPVTDVSPIPDFLGNPRVSRWMTSAFAHLYANSDHEELSMTAFGVGTALSTLHALERPVLILHGHKHYPTVRLLRGVQEKQGDVLLVAAGSAGRAEPWRAHKQADNPIWPSFNIVDMSGPGDGVEVLVTQRAYPPGDGAPVERNLIHVRQGPQSQQDACRSRWQIVTRGQGGPPPGHGVQLDCNRAVFLLEGAGPSAPRWNATVERTVLCGEPLAEPYIDLVDGAPGAHVVELKGVKLRAGSKWPARVELPMGQTGSYRLVAGLCGTFEEAVACEDKRTAPYDWVDLFNRFQCREAEIVLRGLPRGMGPAFGAVVDLTSGIEKPFPLGHENGDYILTMKPCPPRTLLRILWPLATG